MALCALGSGCGPGGTEGAGSRGGGSNVGLRDLEFVNTTNVEGTGVAEVVVPLGVGDFKDVPHIRTADGDTCQAFAMGPRFDDGSIRYLRLDVPLTMKAMERRTLAISATDASLPGFQRHGSIPPQMGVDAVFRVKGQEFAFPAATLIESGPATEVWRSRVRATNTMLWAELTVSIYSKLDHAKFTLQWGNSDPTKLDLMEDPGDVEFHVKGAKVEYEHKSKALWEDTKNGVHKTWLHWKGGRIGETPGRSCCW